MLDNAVMNIGLKPNEFWELRFVDYLRMVIYNARKEANEWDKFRVLYSFVLNTNVTKQHQKTPSQLLPLWIDNLERKRKRVTEADRDRILEAIKRTEKNERRINSISNC